MHCRLIISPQVFVHISPDAAHSSELRLCVVRHVRASNEISTVNITNPHFSVKTKSHPVSHLGRWKVMKELIFWASRWAENNYLCLFLFMPSIKTPGEKFHPFCSADIIFSRCCEKISLTRLKIYISLSIRSSTAGRVLLRNVHVLVLILTTQSALNANWERTTPLGSFLFFFLRCCTFMFNNSGLWSETTHSFQSNNK